MRLKDCPGRSRILVAAFRGLAGPGGVAGLVVAAAWLGAAGPPARIRGESDLKVALRAARWIESSTVDTPEGMAWPVDPRDPKKIDFSLYSGTPGVVLFFDEAYRSTGKKEFLEKARRGADYLMASTPRIKDTGLYTGLAGVGFALEETFKVTQEVKYREGARRCAELIRVSAVKIGRGVQWNDTTDIISGGSGTGLFLLYVARELNDASFRDLATEAGHRLVELGRPEGAGVLWPMDPTFPRLMPNFSHGTAGVAYFLATLYQEVPRKEFLDAALSGARYLQSIATTDGEVCLIYHHVPDGKSLYYLGWCHGPVGTARLFYRLWKVTGDPTWMDWVRKSARGIMTSGIPDKLTPGFWNNVSQCCGSAGVAQFFYDLYRVTQDRAYFDFSRRVTTNLLSRATQDGGGLKWIQAENRIQPDELIAQTGYMQGAAGIGMWFLRLHDYERGRLPGVSFPDTPW